MKVLAGALRDPVALVGGGCAEVFVAAYIRTHAAVLSRAGAAVSGAGAGAAAGAGAVAGVGAGAAAAAAAAAVSAVGAGAGPGAAPDSSSSTLPSTKPHHVAAVCQAAASCVEELALDLAAHGAWPRDVLSEGLAEANGLGDASPGRDPRGCGACQWHPRGFSSVLSGWDALEDEVAPMVTLTHLGACARRAQPARSVEDGVHDDCRSVASDTEHEDGNDGAGCGTTRVAARAVKAPVALEGLTPKLQMLRRAFETARAILRIEGTVWPQG